jgi:AcrR family transcriptional regulator
MAATAEPGLRGRKKQQTREAIIRAGIELFAERGFKATKVEDIAAAVNISRRTFFLYFRTKDDLMFEEQRRGAAALRERLENRSDAELTVDVLAQFMEVSRTIESPEVLRLRRLRYAVVAAEPRLQGPDHSEFAEAIRAPLRDAFALDLQRAGHESCDAPARILAGLTIGAAMAAVYIRRESVMNDGDLDALPPLESITETIISTLRAAYAAMAGPGETHFLHLR